MIQLVGDRYPRLFFSDEEKEPFYFKEDVIFPEDPPERPNMEDLHPLSLEERKDLFLNIGRRSVKIEGKRNLSDRVIATVRLSEMLGISDIITPAKKAEFLYEGESILGIKMPAAKGVAFSGLNELPELNGYRLYYTANAARQLTILMMFDFICGQIDRHSKNLKLLTDIDFSDIRPVSEGREDIPVKGIVAIDHDLSFGLNGYDDIKKRVSAGRCISPEILGKVQYTAIDIPFYEKIKEIKEEDFKNKFGDILSEGEIEAFFDRTNGLIKILESERESEEKRSQSGEVFFSRFIETDAEYEENLKHMEDFANNDKDNHNIRFSYRPSYLKKYILSQRKLGEE